MLGSLARLTVGAEDIVVGTWIGPVRSALRGCGTLTTQHEVTVCTAGSWGENSFAN